MKEDRTGWDVIFDGTDRGEWGREILPARPQQPSELWVTPARRKYTWTGNHTKQPPQSGVEMEHQMTVGEIKLDSKPSPRADRDIQILARLDELEEKLDELLEKVSNLNLTDNSGLSTDFF